MSEELSKEIIAYIDGHDRGVLATVKGDVPRASSVLYVNEGMTLYVGRFPMVKNMLTLAGLAKDQVLLKITPARLYFSDYTKGTGHRDKITL